MIYKSIIFKSCSPTLFLYVMKNTAKICRLSQEKSSEIQTSEYPHLSICI